MHVYIDTDVILDILSETETREVIEAISSALDDGHLTLVCSELALIEVLVHARRSGNKAFEDLARRFLTARPKVILVPVTSRVLERGLDLRATVGLKTPDAIHVATGVLTNCSQFLSRDKQWKRAGISAIDAAQLAALL